MQIENIKLKVLDEAKKISQSGWRTVRFGDVVRNVDSSVKNPLEQGIERFVGLEHLDPESLHVKRWGNVADGTSFTRKFVRGQVLFGKRRAYQRKAAVADFDGICSGDILVFEPKTDELLPELLPFVVQSDGFFEHALGTSAGSLSPRTKWSDMARYEFALPPKDEQRRIAEILWAIENANQNWTKVKISVESLIESLTEKVFFEEDKIVAEQAKLEDVSLLITKGESPSWQGFAYQKAGVRFITSENVLFGKFQAEPEKFIPEDFHNKLKRSKIKSEDILINLVGASIGRACIVPKEIEEANINQAVAVIRLNKTKILPEFILSYILSKSAMKALLGEAVNTARANLSLQNIRNITLPVPDIQYQVKFCEEINSLKSSLNILQKHLESFLQLKKEVMKYSFEYH